MDPNNETFLEGAFTYTVAKGHPPATDPLGVAAFVLWLIGKPMWAVNANRLSLYRVLAALSVPEPLPRSSTMPPKGRIEEEVMEEVERAIAGGATPASVAPWL